MTEPSPSSDTTGAHLRALGRHTAVYGLGQALGPLLGFLLLPVFTAYLSPAEFGVLALLALLSLVVKSVLSLGSGSAMGVCYYDRQDREHRDATVWTACCLYGGVALALGLAAAPLGPPVSRLLFFDAAYGVEVTLTLITAGALIVADPLLLKLRFDERSAAFVGATAAGTAVTVGLTVAGVVLMDRGVRGYVEGMCLGRLLAAGIAAIPVLPGIRPRFRRRTLRELLTHGLPVVPSFACLFLLRDGNKYLLQWMDGLAALGVYNVGASLGMTLDFAVAAFTAAWFPFYLSFKHRQDEACRVFPRVLVCYVIGFGALVLLFFIFGRPVVRLMTAADFHQAFQVVGLTAAAHFFIGLSSILGPGMYFAKELKFLPLIQGSAAVVAGCGCLALIPRFGQVGAVFGLLLGCASLPVLFHRLNVRRKYLPIAFPWPRVARVLLVYGALASMAYFVVLEDLTAHLLLSVALAAGVPVLAWRLLRPEERRFIKHSLGARPDGTPEATAAISRPDRRETARSDPTGARR